MNPNICALRAYVTGLYLSQQSLVKLNPNLETTANRDNSVSLQLDPQV